MLRGDLAGEFAFSRDNVAVGETLTLNPQPGRSVSRRFLPRTGPVDRLRLTRRDGALSELHLYQLDHGEAAIPPGRTVVYHLSALSGDAPVPLGREKQAEWLGSYRPADHQYAVLTPAPDAVAAPAGLAGLRAHHLFTPPQVADVPLKAVRLQLR